MGGKHTPGPLEARPEAGSASDGLHMVVDTTAPSGMTVCTASYCTKADATLYAAAPDLLAALKALRDELCGVDQWWGKLREAAYAADAAISKAEPAALAARVA